MDIMKNGGPQGDQLAPFRDEEAAYRFVERCVWPAGPVCPHCGRSERVGPLRGSSTRIGLYKCYECRRPFTVKVGTILESSNLPMHKWLQAILLTASRGPISASELSHVLNVAPRTASYVLQRIAGHPTLHLHERLAGLAANRNSTPSPEGNAVVRLSKDEFRRAG
jgi:transposase-like protein